MRHQPQIVFDERAPGLLVPLGRPLQAVPLLLRRQGPGKGPGVIVQPQQQQRIRQQRRESQCENLDRPHSFCL